MPVELIALTAVMIALTLYALFGGADFGAGIWEFSTALQSSEREQKLIYGAIGPVWEANHVWLIFALVVMFGAFPAAFAGLCRALWLPLLLALVGIVFRGVGFAFHSYAAPQVRFQATWGAVFALASTASPFFLGACIGAIASGRLAVTAQGDYAGNHLTDWISPLAVFTAFFSVGMCAYLAAVYLTRDAWRGRDEALTKLWRQRALGSGVWVGVLSMAGLAVLATDAPDLWVRFQRRAWPLVAAAIGCGLGSLWALWQRHFMVAAAGAAATVVAVLWGWATAQYPLLIPPDLTVAAAKAPDNVLWLIVATIGVGSLFVGPSMVLLLLLFKGKRPAARSS